MAYLCCIGIDVTVQFDRESANKQVMMNDPVSLEVILDINSTHEVEVDLKVKNMSAIGE